jgi:hypothetical protein
MVDLNGRKWTLATRLAWCQEQRIPMRNIGRQLVINLRTVCGLCGHTPRVNAGGHLHVKSLILFTLRNFTHSWMRR